MTLLALALLVFSAWYAPGRLELWLELKKGLWLWRIGTLAAMAAYIAIIMSGWYTSVSRLAGLLYNLLGLFLMFQAYLFLLTAAADAVRLVARAKAVPPRLATAIILASVLLVLAGHIMARRLSITETEIAVKGLPAPVAIVHAPDLHLGAQRGASWLQRTIAAINDLKPDLVIYNGDLADSNVALTERIFGLFKEVSAPQYYTTGNHEYYIDTERALALAKGAGLIVLRNQAVETAGLQLAGLEYMNADRETYDAHMVNSLTIEEELPKLGLDPDRPIVVIHHSPVGLEYVQKAGADVMLSGHTHGGQVFPGTLLIRQRFPYFKGFYQAGPTALLVSQGAGTFGPWMRLGSFSEIQLVRLVPAK